MIFCAFGNGRFRLLAPMDVPAPNDCIGSNPAVQPERPSYADLGRQLTAKLTRYPRRQGGDEPCRLGVKSRHE